MPHTERQVLEVSQFESHAVIMSTILPAHTHAYAGHDKLSNQAKHRQCIKCTSRCKHSTASHLFVMVMVLDPATKRCELFPESLRNAAYDHVCAFTSEAAASLPAETDGGDTDESSSPSAKHAKTDSRSASLKFLATAAVTPVPAAD